MFPKSVLILLASAVSAFPQEMATSMKSDFLSNFDDVSKKIVSLAEAVPADKYNWRPQDGVRSVAQVYVHIVGANFMIPNALGAKPPADVKLSRDMEKTLTDKAQIVDMLKKSMTHARQALSTALDKPGTATKLFGKDSNYTATSLLIVSHLHEHLGQSIAYARSNGVTPPWSQKGGD